MTSLKIAIVAAIFIAIIILYNTKFSQDWHDDKQSSESGHWRGPFYVNRKDKRIFLQKNGLVVIPLILAIR